jgi:transposase
LLVIYRKLSGHFSPLKSLDSELISQLKETLPDALFAKLNGSLSFDQERLKFVEYKVRVLEERLRLVRIEKYGPGSEKLSDAQLELLELEPGVSSAEVQAESERAQLKLPLKGAKKHPGRQELPAHLPRIEKIIACTPEQCVCGNCGKENSVIGYEQSEQLDVKPAEYFVVVTKREKRACKDCEEQGVQSAPLPARIIDKGLASNRVVIDTLVSKYADYVPLYRQSAILERETGIELSRATLDGWVMRVGELLSPIAAAMGQELLRATISRQTRPRWMCRCMMAGEKTTKPTFGNTAGQPDQWSSTFEWVVNEKGPNGSWVISRGSSKVTVTGLTIMSAEPESSTRRAGRMPGESSSRRSKSIPKIRARSGSWRRWMNSLLSMAEHRRKV